jgi:hypothetical protein
MKSFLKAMGIILPIFATTNSLAQTRSTTGVVAPTTINTTPAGISQFQAETRLITQNSFVSTGVADVRNTGNFGATARWNSMGNLSAGTQILNGFRTQTNGRALASGHSINTLMTGGMLSNPFIQWIGNNGISPVVTPGTLEFKFALSPGAPGAPATDVTLFNMQPNTAGTGGNSYATNGLVGQLAAGNFGDVFGLADRWFGAGQFTLPSSVVMGSRSQLDGCFLTSNIAQSGGMMGGTRQAIIGFGDNASGGSVNQLSFKYYNSPTLDPITGGTELMRIDRNNLNVKVGQNNYISFSSARLAVLDGNNPVPSSLVGGMASIANSIAVYGISSGTNNSMPGPAAYSAAVVGDVANSAANGSGIISTPANTYGILGIASNSTVPASTANRFAGFFVGNLAYTGTLFTPSDRKLKDQIEQEKNMLQKVMQLNPVHYVYKQSEYKNLSLSAEAQHGFISQELEQVFPELVKQINTPVFNKEVKAEEQGFRGINYIQLIPVLTKAIQELNSKVEQLEAQLQKTQLEVVAGKPNGVDAVENTRNPALMQNVPNPFSQNTTITYSVPEKTRQAVLSIIDMNGKIVKQYNLEQGANRQQVISANTLKPGIYIYTLLADGVELMSKKMVVTE